MTVLQGTEQRTQWLGEAWIRALLGKDYRRLAGVCQPEVRSRLMTPRRFDAFENALALTQKVEYWFKECSSIHKEQSRIYLVGEKLAIFYRLSFEKGGLPYTAEQQLYCSLRDGLIDQLSLVCSGFQPVQRMEEAPVAKAAGRTEHFARPDLQPDLHVDATLKIDTGGGQVSTCAILTPSIKRKLVEMSSGQVLEVHVDDPSAKEDIDAWCRLSGNSLVKMDLVAGQELLFYLKKK